MNDLSAEHFDEFFREVHGVDPFPWQSRLARRAATARRDDAGWPAALALPTSAGKTACIDVAVFALACQAQWDAAERTAPRRIFLVVDRRVIVDDTYRRAERLAEKLADADSGVVKDVADRLLSLAQEGNDAAANAAIPLDVFRMRGGAYRDDRWVRSPLQPTVVVSTVDQFGSRLLFRGYGPSGNMRPVHAGLSGNDSLVVLDEAHCANPFRQTMAGVQRYRLWTDDSHDAPATPFQVVLLSATPPAGIADADTLTAENDDRAHPVLGARVGCAKPTRLVRARIPVNAEGSGTWASRLAEEAAALVNDQRRAIGVMVNRVAIAKSAYQVLTGMGHDAVLLTGRMRPIDHARTLRRLEGLRTGEARSFHNPLFVVATQTLEVGADLDFDGLVTECASLDALRQRFGRLNRAGRAIDARGVIMAQLGQLTARGRVDPIYGETLANTWEWLAERAGDGVVDFGYDALDRLLPANPDERRELLSRLSAPAPDAPVMLPAHVDAWAQTSPVPQPDPDVSIFLHGPSQRAPDVQVCWRSDLPADLSLSYNERLAVDVLSLCPPVSAECIPVPISHLRRWLRGDDAALNLSDLSGDADDGPDGGGSLGANRQAIRWRGPQDSHALNASNVRRRGNLRPGDTVVIPALLGGWDAFGHVPNREDGGHPVVDVGDEAQFQARGIPLLRIHEGTLDAWPDGQAKNRLLELAQRNQPPDDEEEIAGLVDDLTAADDIPQWLRDAAEAWHSDRRRRILEHPAGGLVLKGTRRAAKFHGEAGTPTDEDDSYSATVDVPMENHLAGVARWAAHFAHGAGLSERLQHDLALAARFHDLGKADPRMQAMFHGGSAWVAAASDTVLAKSGNWPTGWTASRRARREAGYPTGFRHELLSVRMIENAVGLLDTAHDRDLVLHLVASHHGRCRPFAPVVDDPDAEDVAISVFGYDASASSRTGLERLDSGVPERFWRLTRRYGWWGLALLEALVRVADHRRSEQEEIEHRH